MANKQTRFSFKSDVKFDIALLTEVEQLNPYAYRIQKKIWEDIAQNLVNCELKMAVTERSCRDRTTLILQEFEKDEALSLRSSGIDEESMGSLTKLLTSVAKLSKVVPSKKAQKLFSKPNRVAAEAERDFAVQDVEISAVDDAEIEDLIDEESSNQSKIIREEQVLSPTSDAAITPKRVRKGDVVDYLEKKYKSELELRKEEIELRKYEAETRRMEIDFEKKKQEQKHQARMEELELQKASETAKNQERAALTNALFELIQKK